MTKDLNALEIELLLTAIKKKYGYDFFDYAKTSIHRRLSAVLRRHNIDNLGQCQHQLIQDPNFFSSVLNDLTITVSDLFRDPEAYRSLKNYVFPYFQNQSLIKIWHAGCARGEEVYSMAILLKESNLYEKAIFYATDINQRAIEYAKCGLYSQKTIQQGQKNYLTLNPHGNFSQYFLDHEQDAMMDTRLSERIVFSTHNLVTDQSFGEMQLIMCRNVLIYFNKNLQNHVLQLFTESLSIGGYLCLGSKETIRFSSVSSCYEIIDKEAKLYRKTKDFH